MLIKAENSNKNLAMLFSSIVGKDNVLTDREDMIMYAKDSSCVSSDLYLPSYVLNEEEETKLIENFVDIKYGNNADEVSFALSG